MSIWNRQLRMLVHSRQLDFAAFTTVLAFVSSWLVFWFGD
jgi:hypothetical protein